VFGGEILGAQISDGKYSECQATYRSDFLGPDIQDGTKAKLKSVCHDFPEDKPFSVNALTAI
jgi:hypothetical protein